MSEDGVDQGVAHVSAGGGKAVWLATDLYTAKAVGDDTNGAFSLFEVTAPPQSGPPPHIHHREDESYYVLEGEFEFLDNGRSLVVGAGSFVHLPKGRLHMHKNWGNTPAKALVYFTPAGLEDFFEEAGVAVTEATSLPPPPDPATIERIVEIAQKYGVEVPPPPTSSSPPTS